MGSWREEQKLVEDKLRRQDEAISGLEERQTKVEIDLAVVKAKATIYGGACGFIAGAVVKYILGV